MGSSSPSRLFRPDVKIVPIAAVLLLLAGAAAAEEQEQRTVTLDVKDEDVHDILKSMQKQCGIRNLVIDPNVAGTGTFYLTDVPCKTAFDVVLSTMGLAAADEESSVLLVGKR